MEWDDLQEDGVLAKLTAASSLISAVVLFALSMAAVIAVGCVLGAMVVIERLARQCNSDDCEDAPARIENPSRAAIAG